MKRRILVILCILVMLAAAASADKARWLSSDGNSNHHVEHLYEHVGLIDCRISANYLKVRTSPGGSNVLGHVEQADTIELIELSGKWAQIRVTYSAPTSPDSWTGLQGWVDSDYVECPCSYSDYYNGFSGQYPDGQIDSSGVNVHELPGTGKRSLFTLNRGKDVVILGSYQATDGIWFYRVLADGKTGFVRQDLVSYTGTYSTPEAAEGLPNKGGIGANPGMPTYIPSGAIMGELLHDSTNVRETANGNVIGRLRRGTTVAILSDTTSRDGVQWYYVSYGNNLRGYIRADLVEVDNVAPYVTAAPYYQYPTATPVPYSAPTAVPYYYATATPVPAATAVPAYNSGTDYASVYNAYLRNNWSGVSADQTSLQDIDGDGVPEFFVWTVVGVRGSVFVYTYSNGYVVPLNTGYTIGQNTRIPGIDQDTNSIGGGGFVYFTSYGIGFLAGGSDSASDSSYSYYLKSGYSLVRVRELVIRRTNYGTTYLLDGRTASVNDVRQFLSVFLNANELLDGNAASRSDGEG